jgi:hypothetical protein
MKCRVRGIRAEQDKKALQDPFPMKSFKDNDPFQGFEFLKDK